jgi:predicted phage terminase large subunit-like protein
MKKKKLPRHIEVQRDLGRRGSLLWFVKKAWAVLYPAIPFAGEKHVALICRHLEAITAGKLKRLKIHVPPGHSKTILVSVIWPVWEWIRFPHLRIAAVSYDGELTRRAASASKKLVESDWFRERWGDLVSVPSAAGDGTYDNNQGGSRKSTSVGGALTGHHMERLIIDDPCNPKYVTEVALAAAEKWYRDVVAGRLNIHLAIVVIMQRVHENDLSSILPVEDGWVELSLPGFFVPERRAVTPFGEDWRSDEGEILAPDLQDEAILREKAKAMGAQTASAQIQQSPTPAGGLLFKTADFRSYSELPPEAFTPKALWIQSWDCTFAKGPKNDFVVGQTWVRVGNCFYLVDQVRRRMGFGETRDSVKSELEKYPRVHTVLIEAKANGDAIIEETKKYLAREGKAGVKVLGVTPLGGKDARANLVVPLFEAHQVLDCGEPWCEEWRAELASFGVAKNDDQVDCTTQALAYLLGKITSYSTNLSRLKETR